MMVDGDRDKTNNILLLILSKGQVVLKKGRISHADGDKGTNHNTRNNSKIKE
jgi:hypothetical protein